MRPYRDAPPSSANTARELTYAPPMLSAPLFGRLGARFAGWLGFSRAPSAQNAGQIVLRVERGELSLFTGGRQVLGVPLQDVLDVELDTRSMRKLEPVVRPDGVLGTGQAIAVDVARIVLVVGSREGGFPLSGAYGSYGESLEWMGKVRHFLRKEGWLPEDERADDG